MTGPSSKENELEDRLLASEERLRLGESAGGIATFAFNLDTGAWDWSPQAPILFGRSQSDLEEFQCVWESTVFPDDLLKLRGAIAAAVDSGSLFAEFRVRWNDEIHWMAVNGKIDSSQKTIRGAVFEITHRKALESRLLALNETLEARVIQVRQEARALELLNQTGTAVAAELNLEKLVQIVTDAGVELTHAQFGAFFYNVLKEGGEAYTLYTISGVPREEFSKFPMPRNTAVFEPTFRGRGIVRSDDILGDPRYGKNPPHHGMPEGHLPVRSYLAASVVSRSGEVLGGLFFGHAQPGVFEGRAERIVSSLAAQAAVAIDNSRLHEASQREIAARNAAEEELTALNRELEHRAEERAKQLSASLNKLAETERRFRLLVEGVTDYAICMLDTTGVVVNWNAGAQRIKGYAPAEIVGRHFSTFYTPEDLDLGVPTKALITAASTGKYEAEGWRLRKDGTRFWASVIINAIQELDGEVIGFAKITRDLTERRASEERARQTQKMEGIGQITGGVAHDFNNLLTIIIGNLEYLERAAATDELDSEAAKRFTANAMKGARRAESLTQRLLAFSRQQPLEPKPLDLSRLVAGMSDLLRRTLGEQITIETVLGGGTWLAEADPNQLELALLNLAVNARDAMPEGGRLTLETANVYFDERYAASQAEVLPGQYVMIAVTDSGSGMTADVKAKAFDPFFTTKDVGHGTGLGLSQVYGFVKQSRGHVKIYSEVGEGTTIKLYFPRVYAPQASEPSPPVTQELAPGKLTEKVLVVEDDEDVRSFSTDTIKQLGYNVVEATNGSDALSILASDPGIQVLFTDVGLPGGMNGSQLAERARELRPHLKVLFTSGYARNAIVHDGRLDAGVELLTKPFTQAALSLKLRDIFDSHQAPGCILLVEDEVMIQMLATEYLEGAGFKVEIAGSATEAMNKLGLIPGGVNALIVDLGLPDKKGDVLIREIRAQHPTLPIVIASGRSSSETLAIVGKQKYLASVTKPYGESELLLALRTLGVRFPEL